MLYEHFVSPLCHYFIFPLIPPSLKFKLFFLGIHNLHNLCPQTQYHLNTLIGDPNGEILNVDQYFFDDSFLLRSDVSSEQKIDEVVISSLAEIIESLGSEHNWVLDELWAVLVDLQEP